MCNKIFNKGGTEYITEKINDLLMALARAMPCVSWPKMPTWPKLPR